MSLAQREDILAAARWIRDIDIQKPAIVERHQRNHGGESTACVEAHVHRVAALFQVQNPYVGILDVQETQQRRSLLEVNHTWPAVS
jgi:hypothetical protein